MNEIPPHAEHRRQKIAAARLSIVSNTTLTGLKLVAGLLSGSLGVLAGLVLVHVTGWHVFDPVAGIGIALLILLTAWRLAQSSFHTLIDAQLPATDIQVVKGILDREPAVQGYHKLRTRKSGSY